MHNIHILSKLRLMLRNTNDYYVSVHRKKLYPHFHLHWCPLQRFFICLLQARSLLQHLLNTSNSQTKSIYLCFQPRVNSLPLKKSDRIWVEGGLTLVCSCPTMPVIMNHEVVENKRAHRQHCSVNSAQNMSLVQRTYNLTCFESVQSIFV